MSTFIKCQRDCLNCKFKDCILSEEDLSLNEMTESDQRDHCITLGKKKLTKSKIYYDKMKNDPEFKKKQKESYRKWREKHKNEPEFKRKNAENCRLNYLKNRERRLLWQKEYYKKHKNEPEFIKKIRESQRKWKEKKKQNLI